MTNRRLFLSTCLTGVVAATLAQAQPYGGGRPGEGPRDGMPDGDRRPYRPIPEMREEPVPELRHGRMWEPGHWHWNGRDYVWIQGRQIATRSRYHRYVPGEWVRRGPGYVWVGAHWQ